MPGSSSRSARSALIARVDCYCVTAYIWGCVLENSDTWILDAVALLGKGSLSGVDNTIRA